MTKVAVFVFSDPGTDESLGRVVNALEAVKEFREAGHEARLYFDGTGTRWPRELSRKDHKANALYESVKDKTAGVCRFCATVFGAKDSIEASRLKLIDEFDQHISLTKLLAEEFHIMNF